MCRLLTLFALLLGLNGYIPAQEMGSCNCVCKYGGISKCVPSFSNFCPDICATNVCGSADKVDTLSTGFSTAACSTTSGQAITYDSVAPRVLWSIGHQGARIWTGDGNNSSLTGEALRAALLGAVTSSGSNTFTAHPDVDETIRQIQYAPTNILETATSTALTICIANYPPDKAFQDFKWVATHEGKIWELDDKHKAKDYDGMRSTFSLAEANDDIRDRLYCYRGSKMDDLMSQLGTVPPKPKPPTTRHYPPHGGVSTHEQPDHN